MIIILLLLIAVGVLLLSEQGRNILWALFFLIWGVLVIGFYISIAGLIGLCIYIVVFKSDTPKKIEPVSVLNSHISNINLEKIQYGSGSQEVVSNASEFFIRNDIYETKNERCVTEHETKICDLKESTIVGFSYSCFDIDSYSFLTKNDIIYKPNVFCATGEGSIYISPNIQVRKFWGQVKENKSDYSNYTPQKYDKCLWTGNAGSGYFPSIDISNSIHKYPMDNKKAFCLNDNKGLDIYTTVPDKGWAIRQNEIVKNIENKNN